MSIEDAFRTNNFTVYLLSIVFSSCVLVVFVFLYILFLFLRLFLQKKVERKIRMEEEQSKTKEKKIEGVDMSNIQVGAIQTILEFDPFHFDEPSEEFTCGDWSSKSFKCWIGMEIIYFFENLFFLFIFYAIITYISSLVAFNYLHWAAGITINIFLTIIAVIHGVRYRLTKDKLNENADLEMEDFDDDNNEEELTEKNGAKSPVTTTTGTPVNTPIIGNNNYNNNSAFNNNMEEKKEEALNQDGLQDKETNSIVLAESEIGSELPLAPYEDAITKEKEETNNNNNNSTVIYREEVTKEESEEKKLKEKKGRRLFLRQEDANKKDFSKYKLIEGPPRPRFLEKEIRKVNTVEAYLRSIQYGITTKVIFFVVYLIIAMLVTVVLTSAFYGICVCTNEYEFTTTFSRYVNSRSLSVCDGNSICSITLFLPEKPQSELIVKFFSEFKPERATIYIDTLPSRISNASIKRNCTFEDLNGIETELVQRFVYTCVASELTPDTAYHFTLGVESFVTLNGSEILRLNSSSNALLETFYSKEHMFRTFRSNSVNGNIKFLVSGDVGYNDKAYNMLKSAVEIHNPSFIAFTGNIAFDNGFLTCYSRWVKFLDRYHDLAVDNNGYSIPLLTAIGNNEALFWRFKAGINEIKPYRSFTQHHVKVPSSEKQRLYHTHHLLSPSSNTCSMMSLDSHIVNSHSSQVDYIQAQYNSTNSKYKMVMYNMPLYPSVTDFSYDVCSDGRKQWEPVFSAYNVTVAFEGYDRTYKRTQVIKNGRVVDNINQSNCAANAGVTYVGDGAFGAELPASISSSNPASFFNQRKITYNYKIVTCDALNGVAVSAYDDKNDLIDQFTRI
ncbi:hypothetical protein ABK040_011988 [Willaertia magna]